jgi:quinol monooxygenase YgiN
MTLTVVARLKARAGKEDELFRVLGGLLAPTRAETGCVRYEMNRSHDDPGLFMFVELWDDRPLWEAHMASPHLTAFAARQGELVESWDLFVGEQV